MPLQFRRQLFVERVAAAGWPLEKAAQMYAEIAQAARRSAYHGLQDLLALVERRISSQLSRALGQ